MRGHQPRQRLDRGRHAAPRKSEPLPRLGARADTLVLITRWHTKASTHEPVGEVATQESTFGWRSCRIEATCSMTADVSQGIRAGTSHSAIAHLAQLGGLARL